MAKLKSSKLYFTPSISEDAVDHRIRFVPDGVAFSYDTPSSELDIAGGPDSKEVVIELADIPNVPKTEGIYDVYITSVDDKGNESDELAIPNAVFDFTPPAAPTNGRIE